MRNHVVHADDERPGQPNEGVREPIHVVQVNEVERFAVPVATPHPASFHVGSSPGEHPAGACPDISANVRQVVDDRHGAVPA